jgi:hypothetical protein
MNKTSLLLAFAVASFAGAAHAQVDNWDSPNLAATCVGEMVTGQSAPSTPAAAPAQQADGQRDASCADTPDLDARSMRVTLDAQGDDKPLVLELAFAGCTVEYPRDEPVFPAYTRRTYKTATGDVLNVYSSEKNNSTFSLYLADGTSSATLINIAATADLISGRPLDMGEILMVKTTNGTDGVVKRAVGSIKSVPSR